MTGYNASIDTFTNADISRLRVTGLNSFEIRDFIESKRSVNNEKCKRKSGGNVNERTTGVF